MQGVASSNPATPTILFKEINGLQPKAATRFSLDFSFVKEGLAIRLVVLHRAAEAIGAVACGLGAGYS